MRAKKQTSGKTDRPAGPKKDEETHSPQKELLEKTRHNPDLGRKPAKQDQHPKSSGGKATRKLGSTTTRANSKLPKHKTLDTSGQDRDL